MQPGLCRNATARSQVRAPKEGTVEQTKPIYVGQAALEVYLTESGRAFEWVKIDRVVPMLKAEEKRKCALGRSDKPAHQATVLP